MRHEPFVPGQPGRQGYAYERHGVCQLFLVCEPLRGGPHVTVTARRTKQDWARCIQELVDVHYPAAQRMALVLDTRNIHVPSALYETFAPGGSAAAGRAARTALHPQAWQLVGHG